MELEICNVMEAPVLTPGDRYLVVLAADSYDRSAAHYVEPYLTVLSVRSPPFTCDTFHAADLTCRGVPGICRLLAVRSCPSNSYNVVVLYTNESDRVGTGCGESGTGWRSVGGARTALGYEAEGRDTSIGGYRHNFGFLILDVCSGIICQVRIVVVVMVVVIAIVVVVALVVVVVVVRRCGTQNAVVAFVVDVVEIVVVAFVIVGCTSCSRSSSSSSIRRSSRRLSTFFSSQPDASLHCEMTANTGLVYRAVCLFKSQLSPVLIVQCACLRRDG